MASVFALFETSYIPLGEAIFRLALAAVLGFAIGLEREIKDKPIGFRPYTLVSLGSASFTLIAMELIVRLGAQQDAVIDPTRVMQGVIGGIGFLGAGALIRAGQDVRGASTGAGIWVMGGVGMACGFGFYGFAVVTAVLALTVLVLGGELRDLVNRHDDDQEREEGG